MNWIAIVGNQWVNLALVEQVYIEFDGTNYNVIGQQDAGEYSTVFAQYSVEADAVTYINGILGT